MGELLKFLGEILTAVGILLLVLHYRLKYDLWGSFTLVGELYSFSCVFGIVVYPDQIRSVSTIRCAWRNLFPILTDLALYVFGLITVRPTPLHSFAFQFG